MLFLLHGAGDAGLAWAPAATHLAACSALRSVRLDTIVAVDLRGHGATRSATVAEDTDLSIQRLVADTLLLATALSDRHGGAHVVLAGHSLGGSVAVRTAVEGLRKTPPLPVAAVMLLDAVEGTAIDGFPKTEAWFRCRPTSFQTLDDAVAWATSSRMLHSRVVAEVSVPSRLRWDEVRQGWVWRTDVGAAAAYWKDWFDGLSEMFTSLAVPKLLLLGGIDRLDAGLEAAHMQGRFRLEVLPELGHQLHEDQPERVAEALAKFLASLQRQQDAFARLQPSPSSNPKRARSNDRQTAENVTKVNSAGVDEHTVSTRPITEVGADVCGRGRSTTQVEIEVSVTETAASSPSAP